LALALPLVGLMACAPWKGPDDVARVVERQTGERFDREVGLTLGRCGLTLARWFVDDDDVPLEGLRKLEVGVYTQTDPDRAGVAPAISAEIFPAWTPLVEVRTDDSERVLLLTDGPEGEIRRLLILVADGEEIAVVRLRGRLDRTLEAALHLAFAEVDRPHLAEPTIAALERSAVPESDGS